MSPASEAGPSAAAGPPRISHADLRLLIDGEWLSAQGRATVPVINPATEEVLGHLPLASAADLDRALEAARRAWPAWRAMPPVQRGRILRHLSIVGSEFAGRVVGDADVAGLPAVVSEVEGSAFRTGRAELELDPDDPLGEGFLLR